MAKFEILDNFTKIPNEIFDVMAFIKCSALAILLHIARQTIGYGKKSDGISISQFAKATGLSVSQVKRAINELKELKLIKVTKQTHKNGGKSYNRYEIIFKAIETLSSKRTKGRLNMNQGDSSKRAMGRADMSHTKENRTKDNRTKEEKERDNNGGEKRDFIFHTLPDNLQAKYLDEYVEHLQSESEYIKSPTAFKLKIKKKIKAGDEEQLQDFEEWYLTRECERLKREYRGKSDIYGDQVVKNIYPYFITTGYQESYDYKKRKTVFVATEDTHGKEIIHGFDSVKELEVFLSSYFVLNEVPL